MWGRVAEDVRVYWETEERKRNGGGAGERREPFANLVSVLRHRAKTQPDQTAYVFMDREGRESEKLTYAMLDEQARRTAVGLWEHGDPGDRVVLLYPQCPEFLGAIFGCLYAGMPAATLYPPGETLPGLSFVQAVMRDCQSQIALSNGTTTQWLKEDLGERAGWERVTILDGAEFDRNGAQRWRRPEINGPNLALMEYASDGSGRPMGLKVSHARLTANMDAYHNAVQPSSTMVCQTPSFYDPGLIFGSLLPVYKGFPCYLTAPTFFLDFSCCWAFSQRPTLS